MRPVLSLPSVAALLGVLAVGAGGACGSDDDAGASSDRPEVVVTTSIIGDIVRHIVGDAADVDVIMPLGADPHEFAPSARQAEAMSEADVLVVNGAGFEQGMTDLVDAARDAGTPTFTFAEHVSLRTLGDGEHADDDPHLWTDPTLVAGALPALGDALAGMDGVDAAAIAKRASDYVAELTELDDEIKAMLDGIPAERRVLVTNHEAFGYFADRYGFDVVGTVIPSLTTRADSSAAELEALADVIEEHDVRAIFAETTQPARLAEALADEVGGEGGTVHVVELFTESLGEQGSGAETYVGMLRTDAQRIAEALS